MSRRFPGGFWPAVGGGEPKKSEAQKRVDKQFRLGDFTKLVARMPEVPEEELVEAALQEAKDRATGKLPPSEWDPPLPSKEVFAVRLKEWREKRGMSQKELMEATGMTQAALSRLEAGRSKPRAKTLSCLAAALKIDVSLLED